MSAVVDGSPWATKAEASAQQARRFSQMKDAPPSGTPPLPPLVRSHTDSATPQQGRQPSLSSTTNRRASVTRPRASTAELDRQAADLSAAPSVSTLNRDFHRLSEAYAGMREEASAPVLISPATHYAGRNARLTSAPAAQRQSIPRQNRRETLGNEDALAAGGNSTTENDEMRRLPEAPPSPPARRPARYLPETATAQAGPDIGVDISTGSSSTGASQIARATNKTKADASPNHDAVVPRRSLIEDAALRVVPAFPPTSPQPPQQQQRVQSVEDTPLNVAAALPPPAQGENEDVDVTETAMSPPPRKPTTDDTTVTDAASPARRAKGKGRDGRIMVVVRKRPLASDDEGADCVQVDGPHIRIAVTKQRVDLSSYEENSDYTFDHAYSAADTNRDVYETSVKDLLTVSLGGGSASCFAYGQTGSGKTYTMMGTDSESGLYLLAVADLFERLGTGQQLSVCFYEIYCNSLFDLLNRRHPIVLREDANRRVNICGVLWRTVTTVEALWQIVKAGMEQRRTGTTSANEHSSRSHAILAIRITDPANADFAGSINFVDLAGSERAADTAAHDRLTRLEGAEINKSLLALKECIRSLDEKKKHVPFRGSRLTEVLRDSFTGNSRTVMIATVSPSAHNHEHTNNTLRYAFRVKGLTIASVEPSKARNAPRPYIPVARTRSSAELNDRSNPASTPVRRPKRRGTHKKSRQAGSRTNSIAEGDSVPTTTTSALSAKDYAMEMMELNSMAEIRARRAFQQRQNSVTEAPFSSSHYDDDSVRRRHRNRHDIADLLRSHHHNNSNNSNNNEDDVEQPSQRRTQRPVYKAPPAQPLLGGGGRITRNSVSSTTNSSFQSSVPVLPPITSPADVDLAALERRLTTRIMSQLRRDLGAQLEDVLSDKDATIAALRRENAALRKALDRAQREARHSDSSSSPPEREARRTGMRLPAFDPPSPSILQEQISSPPSVSSASDDVAYHLV